LEGIDEAPISFLLFSVTLKAPKAVALTEEEEELVEVGPKLPPLGVESVGSYAIPACVMQSIKPAIFEP
jgi:hypothetical protein